jgi:hypothetical protein
MGKYKHKNGEVGSGVALNMIKANSSQPFSLTSSPVNQGDGSRLKKKINRLSKKHEALYNAVVEGYGQNEYTSGNYDKDMKKLHKVEDRLERNEEKYQEKFGESPYSMEGPLNQAWHEGGSDRLFKTMDKIVEAHDEGNFKKVVRKGRQAYRQAARQGLVDPGEKSKKFQRIYPPHPKPKHFPPLPEPLSPLSKGCAKSDGGPGCVEKRGDEYVIINNKKPGKQIWRSGFSSRKAANDNLAGYHASK